MKSKYGFYVGSTPTENFSYPCFYLSRAKWDDYGFSTSFTLYYMEGMGRKKLIGSVKIACTGQAKGRTSLPVDFSELGVEYFSLGQSDTYYRNLKELGEGVKNHVLESLRDVRTSSVTMEIAKSEKAYSFSLTRFLGPLALAGLEEQKKDILSFEFESLIHSSDTPTRCIFTFRRDGLIPSRINALIGVNGAGKTQLLANFVSGILGLGEKKIDVSERESISKVVVVSYSIFDRFFLPDQIAIPANRSRREYISKDLKYVYIGLRERIGPDVGDKDNGAKDLTKIAGPMTFAKKFTSALQKLKIDGRYEQWQKIMAPILLEADLPHDEYMPDSTCRARFRRLGAGHKATLSMLTNLFSELQDNSLVVIDEPENHLHPALLSAMLHVLREMLNRTNSIAVISTHSPIVIQEVPAKFVQVITKFNNQAQLIPLRKESFGTSIDTLMSETFKLTYQMPSYVNILKNLAKQNIPLENIENELERKLSAEARSFYMSMMTQ